MSRLGWRSIVSVGDQEYIGDGRVSMEAAMFSATRVALKNLGLPYETHIGNKVVQSNLEQFCKVRKLVPEYTFEACPIIPQQKCRKQQPSLTCLFSAAVTIGRERFVGSATFEIEQAMADAAREALRQIGQHQRVVAPGKGEVLKELRSFCKLQGLGQPAYSVYFGSSIPDKEPIGCVQERQRMHGGKRVLQDVNNVTRRFYKAKRGYNVSGLNYCIQANAHTQSPAVCTYKTA